MEWIYDTGGREKYYKALNVNDCVTRAIAIANGMDYKETYMALKKYNGGESPRNGVCEFIYKKMLIDLGWEYVDLKAERTSLADADLPNDEIIICRLSGHLVAVVNGVIHDTWNSGKGRKHRPPKELLGYWVKLDEKSTAPDL